MEEEDVVATFVAKPFSALSFQDKKAIVDRGKPKPRQLELSSKNKHCSRKFNFDMFVSVVWLCGSLAANKLYCWPCLLFSNEKTVWGCPRRGYSDLNNLHTAMGRHEKSVGHLTAFVKLQTFGKSRIDLDIDRSRAIAVRNHNEKVSHNREILKRFIRITCFLGMQELAFRGHDESVTSVNRGNYVEMAHCISEFDETLSSHFQTATVFHGTSHTIQNDLIACISTVLINAVKEELDSCPFAAILLDETSDISCYSQLSIVYRYINAGGRICERFVEFVNVSDDRTAPAISDLVLKRLSNFNLSDKLVAQTYDGAAVMSSHLNGVQAIVRRSAPDAMFVHCYAHKLNLVLSQAASRIPECNVFFSTLGGMSGFFSSSSKRTFSLDEIVNKRFPKLAPTRWTYSSRVVETVKENITEIKQLFEHIKSTPMLFDQKTKNEAQGYLTTVNDFEFNLLLEIFSTIYPFTNYLFNILQSKSMDICFCSSEVLKMVEKLGRIRDSKFADIWSTVLASCGAPNKRRRSELSEEERYRRMFYEILDTIKLQMNERYKCIKDMLFIELVDSNKFTSYTRSFPDAALNALKTAYGSRFDFARLRSELIVLYDNEYFSGKAVDQLLKTIIDDKLIDGFPQITLLLKLILTIPYSTACVERTFSALKRIKTYLRNSQKQERLSNLGIIAIENEYLQRLMRNRDEFYDKIIQEFCKKTRRMEFMYK